MKAKSWSVITKQEDVLIEHYSGPDKGKARDVAARLLGDPKNTKAGTDVLVAKVSQVHIITAGDLKASLPKDIF
jgi:hypothetical protein